MARRSTATASAALRLARRSASTSASAAYLDSPLWHTVLPDRAVLAVEGADSRKLLQGLTTISNPKVSRARLVGLSERDAVCGRR